MWKIGQAQPFPDLLFGYENYVRFECETIIPSAPQDMFPVIEVIITLWDQFALRNRVLFKSVDLSAFMYMVKGTWIMID